MPTPCSRARRRIAAPATASAPRSAPRPSLPTTSSPPTSAPPATRPIAWKPAVNFDHTQARGSCSTCHNGAQAQGKPPSHIVTDLECDACHTTLTWAGAVFTHQGVTSNCASCHDGVRGHRHAADPHPDRRACPARAATRAPTSRPSPARPSTMPAVTSLTCASCHETANFLGMHPSTNTTAADSRPNATLDANHPKTGDCVQCHDTTSFAQQRVTPGEPHPDQCAVRAVPHHPGNYALYSVTGTHQGVTELPHLSRPRPCAATFANITIVSTPGQPHPDRQPRLQRLRLPHARPTSTPGGFRLGTREHLQPDAQRRRAHDGGRGGGRLPDLPRGRAVSWGCSPSSGTTAGDSRPSTTLDAKHPRVATAAAATPPPRPSPATSRGAGKPANHIPTSAPCTQCHTTAGNYALYSVTGTHQGVTQCLSCHGPDGRDDLRQHHHRQHPG